MRRKARGAIAAHFRRALTRREASVYTPGHDAVVVECKRSNGAQKVFVCQTETVWLVILAPADEPFPGLHDHFGQGGLPAGHFEIGCPAHNALHAQYGEPRIRCWEAVRDVAEHSYRPLFDYAREVAQRWRREFGSCVTPIRLPTLV